MSHLRKVFLSFLVIALPALAQNLPIVELPPARVGVHYNAPLKIHVAIPFQLTKSAGSLPEGLELTSAGTIQGVPKSPDDQLFVLTVTDADGNSTQHEFRMRVEKESQSSQSQSSQSQPDAQKCAAEKDLAKRCFNDEDEKISKFQIVGGVEQSGVASLPSQTNAFLSAFTRAGVDTTFKLWARIRLLGAPTASTGGVISAFQDPTGQIKNLDTQKVGQAVDFVLGPDYQIPKLTSPSGKYSVHLIGGFGATTPLSAEDVVSRFKVPSKSSPMCADVVSRFTPQNGYPANLVLPNPDPTSTNCLANGITVLAFNRQERTRFLRKYGVGFRTIDRFKSKSTDEKGTSTEVCCERGIVDFIFGQDEAITGGKLHGWVFRVDGVHPLPIAGNILYLFGTASLRITHNQDLRTLILDADNSGATPSASNVALLPLKQPDKDFYRFGVGLDFVKMIKNMKGQQGTTNKQTNQNASGGGSQ